MIISHFRNLNVQVHKTQIFSKNILLKIKKFEYEKNTTSKIKCMSLLRPEQ